MEFEYIFLFFFAMIILNIVARSFDRERIERHIKANDGELISKRWSPFGTGWIGEKDSRIYKVEYRDKNKNKHKAYVKTSMLSGVYFTDDKIMERSKNDSSHDLKNENKELKKEIARLKRNRWF